MDYYPSSGSRGSSTADQHQEHPPSHYEATRHSGCQTSAFLSPYSLPLNTATGKVPPKPEREDAGGHIKPLLGY